MSEEPSSPPPEPRQNQDAEAAVCSSGAEPVEEETEEESEESEERRENPLVPRHIGVPVLGLDLMAEMKARQEKMAAKKVSERQRSKVKAVLQIHEKFKFSVFFCFSLSL